MSTSHPFLDARLPIDWSTLTPEHARPDVRLALQKATAALTTLRQQDPQQLTFESTFLALEHATTDLDRAWGRINHLDSVCNSPELRAAINELLPEVVALTSSIPLDSELWQVLKHYAEQPEAQQLPPLSRRHLEETLAAFSAAGADLSPSQKEEMAQLNAELAQKTQTFSEHVLDSTNAWEKIITDPERLHGLPESARHAAAQDARENGHPGAWRFTLHAPSLLPVLQYAQDPELRREVWSAASAIATTTPHDNTPLVFDILALRHRRAQLLGHDHFPDAVLARRMAATGERALTFVQDLHAQIHHAFQREGQELRAFKAQTLHPDAPADQDPPLLEPWETSYWAEKQRQALFDFEGEALRPYFPLQRVMDGLFQLATQLFHVEIRPRPEQAAWHPEVQTYDLHDQASGQLLGTFYTDWHPRPTKRAGAWMNHLETAQPAHGDHPALPHLGLICGNMTRPQDGQPALMTHEEVETIFHEFGHLLHHLLSTVSIPSLAGTNVPWDFVELPSQLMENFCWQRESLDLFARHHETDEPIPEALFQKMLAARNHLSASAFMRQLSLGKLDLELHLHPQRWEGRSLEEIDREILADYRPQLASPVPSIIPRFNHLFSSSVGYAAGYYSYKWAEVLDADAFSRFLDEGILNEQVGLSLRREILSTGNSRPVEESFRAFMGRDPDTRALLARSGLLE